MGCMRHTDRGIGTLERVGQAGDPARLLGSTSVHKRLHLQCLQPQTRLYPLGSGAWLPRWMRPRRLAKGVI